MTDQQKEFMLEAIRLSQQGMDLNEGGPFGCVIVKDNVIVGRGNNKVLSTNDPTAHAEITAIRDACAHLNTYELSDCELFTSCEPCPMCLSAIYWARIRGIYFACTRKDAALIGFDDDFIYKEIPKEFDRRAIAISQIMHDEAFDVLTKWLSKPDRIEY